MQARKAREKWELLAKTGRSRHVSACQSLPDKPIWLVRQEMTRAASQGTTVRPAAGRVPLREGMCVRENGSRDGSGEADREKESKVGVLPALQGHTPVTSLPPTGLLC